MVLRPSVLILCLAVSRLRQFKSSGDCQNASVTLILPFQNGSSAVISLRKWISIFNNCLQWLSRSVFEHGKTV